MSPQMRFRLELAWRELLLLSLALIAGLAVGATSLLAEVVAEQAPATSGGGKLIGGGALAAGLAALAHATPKFIEGYIKLKAARVRGAIDPDGARRIIDEALDRRSRVEMQEEQHRLMQLIVSQQESMLRSQEVLTEAVNQLRVAVAAITGGPPKP